MRISGQRGKPEWLKKRIRPGMSRDVEHCIQQHGLHTVCTEAACPNRNECFSRGTATFMILGNVCTRNCRFCNVRSGIPAKPEPDEVCNVVSAVRTMGLSYTVVTSVTRDDLPDGGSGVFERLIREFKKEDVSVEVLTPDFQGSTEDIDRIIQAEPNVFNHNLETVGRLYRDVRPRASYARSLDLIRQVSGSGLISKSGIMLGVGETDEEIFRLFEDLLHAGCMLLTVGQYLRPNRECIPVHDYVHPDHFSMLREKALSMGFRGVASGVFVRSSYNAREMYKSIS